MTTKDVPPPLARGVIDRAAEERLDEVDWLPGCAPLARAVLRHRGERAACEKALGPGALETLLGRIQMLPTPGLRRLATLSDARALLEGDLAKLLAEQGEPNGYIVGREAGGAFIVGARYGSGTLYHKVEGQKPVYWTGPSIGFDAGANAGNTFVLVYNLYDTEELYERYPSGEGQAYLIGGMTASYLRKGDVVLIPIRVGAGLRLGINAGYMKFSKKQRWLPF